MCLFEYVSGLSFAFISGQIPVRDLNYAAVAMDTPFTRDVVEESVRDVINEFSRALSGHYLSLRYHPS